MFLASSLGLFLKVPPEGILFFSCKNDDSFLKRGTAHDTLKSISSYGDEKSLKCVYDVIYIYNWWCIEHYTLIIFISKSLKTSRCMKDNKCSVRQCVVDESLLFHSLLQ